MLLGTYERRVLYRLVPLSTNNPLICLDLISKKLVGMSLKCLESFYEDMSFMESELCCGDSGTPEERFESWSAKISPGLKDSVDKHSPCHITWKTGNAQNELRGALEVASLEHAHKRFHDLCSHGGEQFLKYGRNVLSECYPLSFLNQDAATDDMQVTDIADADELTDTKILLNTLDAKPCLQTTCTENSARYYVYICMYYLRERPCISNTTQTRIL